ncbi:hypothetical protein VTP01DRAFT_5930 [Rhizomucor pusillus]|uniref:uncharacterized protein n=1 Tax=Rhizomucor pusillus TaxID=4840 RepID=UPI00374330E9
MSEETFIRQHLQQFIDHIFSYDERFAYNWSNSFLQVSGVQEQDMQKPDYLASVIPDIGFKYDVFVLEVKKRRKQSNQYFSDLVKTGKEMKRMVDAMVELGVESPAALGIVVAGDVCRMFKTDLEFDGIYRMIQIGQFHLIRSTSDVNLTLTILEHLTHIKTLTCQVVSKIKASFSGGAEHQNHRLKFKRKSFGSPLIQRKKHKSKFD